jgi:hypothetical protein
MAVTLSGLNDTLISQLALSAFVDQLAPLKAFSTSYSADAARRGQVISVPLIASVTATATENAYESADTGSATNRDLVMNVYRKCTAGIKDSQWWNSSFVQIESFSSMLAASVASSIQTLIFNSITSGNYASSITGTSGTFGLAGIRKARLAITNNKAPRDNRFIVLNSTAYDSVLGDLSSAYLYGDASAIQDGAPAKAVGVSIIEAPSLPDNGQNMFGFIAHPSAMALCVRPLIPQDNSMYLEQKVVNDEQSGLGLNMRRHYAPATGTHWITLEALCGFTSGVTNGIVRITS